MIRSMIAAFAVLAMAAPSTAFNEPPPHRILLREGQPGGRPGGDLRLLVWNIEKAKQGEVWRRDFERLLKQSDLALVQESHLVDPVKKVMKAVTSFEWFFVVSFLWRGYETGVASVSHWPSENPRWYKSPDNEPILMTPKMAMSLVLPLSDGRRLLVFNVHALNFVVDGAFKNQIRPLAGVAKAHDGPVIFAGDFNTWNENRMRFLKIEMHSAGLYPIRFDGDRRRMRLDHVFVRGLKIKSAVMRTDVSTSDHWPIQTRFSL